eukprot:CAMPEP_0172859462 /NCGR_PEP_ID=MMETSP1075-20121228/70091_1 /TAXON_ID=2916 /ORGANISM="Ceratium fusus, Strain PA161109" /LENGTH=57 /DNA_ID=CAMNT_0013707277 /DNA_START=9 /DNA_END=178 /DNA_ORIENTATION=+
MYTGGAVITCDDVTTGCGAPYTGACATESSCCISGTVWGTATNCGTSTIRSTVCTCG